MIVSMFLCDLVTVSLLNVLVTIIRSVLEPFGFACVTASIHLSSYCYQHTSSRNCRGPVMISQSNETFT